jgi:hypothetical protein
MTASGPVTGGMCPANSMTLCLRASAVFVANGIPSADPISASIRGSLHLHSMSQPDLITTAPSTKPDPFPPLDREAYVARCRMRWHGPALADAIGNWKLWQEIRPKLNEAMLRYRAPGQWDTLTDFLWKLQREITPDMSNLWPLLDFCDHHQKIHLGRGLLIYCEFILKGIKAADESAAKENCTHCGKPLEEPGATGCCCACIRKADEADALSFDYDPEVRLGTNGHFDSNSEGFDDGHEWHPVIRLEGESYDDLWKRMLPSCLNADEFPCAIRGVHVIAAVPGFLVTLDPTSTWPVLHPWPSA